MPNNSYDIFEAGYDEFLQKPGLQPLETASSLGSTTNVATGGFSDIPASSPMLATPLSSPVPTSSILPGELGQLIGHGKKTFSDTTAGFLMGVDTDGVYKWILGNETSSADWSVTTANTFTIVGSLAVTAGSTIAGFEVGTDYIRDVANSFGLASTVSGGDDVRFWAGATYANRASAPYRVTEAGVFTATSGTIGGWTLSSTQLSSASAFINSSVPSIGLGSVTDYFTGTGFWVGLNSGSYKLHIGNPAGDYLKWDGSNLTVTGVIIATTATIASTTTDTYTINSDLTDANIDLVWGRTTGGNATMRYNGTTVNVDKTFTVSGTTVVLESRTITAGAGLTGGGALSSNLTLTVGAGAGITVNADDVALTTPGTLTVSTSNSASGNHTHAITSSSNPGAAASILASDSSGFLTLVKLNTDTLADKSGGNLTISPTGDIVLDPAGNDVLPNTNYDINLGGLTKKYLTLHAAELWVETLVAQDTIATIGGRILVGPTTSLIADVGTGDTTIDVKHNEMASGDRVYLEADGKVEFMAVTSGASVITGGYRYSVTRNLDGSGANLWYAGDAVFNTGTTGDGFIDLYSVDSVKSASQTGPTIVGNVRNSSTYNDWTEHWAIGNLNGLYGYGVTTYGVAFGEYAASKAHITLDSTNGIRFFTGTTSVVAQWSVTGTITVGSTSTEHVSISSTAIQFKDGSTVYTDLTAGVLSLGDTSNEHTLINTSGVALKDGSNVYGLFAATTTIGLTTSEHVSISSTAVQIKDGSSVYTDLAAGVLTLGLVSGGEYMSIDGTNGICMFANAVNTLEISNTGVITVGEVGASKSNVQISSGQIALRTNTTNKITLNTSGNISLLGSLEVSTSGNIKSGQTAYNTGTGFFLEYNSGTPRFSIGDGTDNASLTWDGSSLKVNGSTISNYDIFGDGSDGDVNINSGSFSSGPITSNALTRDAYFDDLTLSGGDLNCAGYRLFVKGVLTINGTYKVHRNGNNGSNGAAGPTGGAGGTALAAAYLGGSAAGGAGGGASPNGTAGSNGTSALGAGGGKGGDTTSNVGGTGGTVTAPPATSGSFRVLPMASILYDYIVGARLTGGAGGGGGGRQDGSDAGGGGGSGGGVVLVAARTIVNNGVISVNGGNGGNGYDGGGGDGGSGGGGGGGGYLVLVYGNYSGSGTKTASGGTGGSLAGAGGSQNGTNGTAGTVLELVV